MISSKEIEAKVMADKYVQFWIKNAFDGIPEKDIKHFVEDVVIAARQALANDERK